MAEKKVRYHCPISIPKRLQSQNHNLQDSVTNRSNFDFHFEVSIVFHLHPCSILPDSIYYIIYYRRDDIKASYANIMKR